MVTNDIDALFKLARIAGARFDLIQAGGGNISLKADDGILYIKASGISLSEMVNLDKCAQIELIQLKNFVDNLDISGFTSKTDIENIANQALVKVNLTPDIKPSIETFFHIYGYKFTLHTHPILVNAIMISDNASDIISKLFPHALLVEYFTPGIELAVAISSSIDNHYKKQ